MDLDTSFDFVSFFMVPIGIYLLWFLFYFIINFVVAHQRIRERNYDCTLLYYQRKPWAKKLLEKYGTGMVPVIFLGCHFLFFFVSHCFSIFCLYSFEFHTLAVVFWLTWSIMNGSSFYMDYFSKKYEQSLQKMDLLEQQLAEPK